VFVTGSIGNVQLSVAKIPHYKKIIKEIKIDGVLANIMLKKNKGPLIMENATTNAPFISE